MIYSAQDPTVKRLKALAGDPAARRDAGLFLVEGPKLAREALQSKVRVRQALLAPGSKMRPELAGTGVEIIELGEKAFASISGTETPQGIILLLEIPRAASIADSKASLCVAADTLQDPGNLGTLLRSAWACAVDAVFLGEGCADAFSPKCVRAAAGAQLHLAIEAQVDLVRKLQALGGAGVQILALDAKAKTSLWDTDLRKASCLVLGSEGQGLSPDIQRVCSAGISLNYPGSAESLNAGVSISIALFEALRQRQKN